VAGARFTDEQKWYYNTISALQFTRHATSDSHFVTGRERDKMYEGPVNVFGLRKPIRRSISLGNSLSIGLHPAKKSPAEAVERIIARLRFEVAVSRPEVWWGCRTSRLVLPIRGNVIVFVHGIKELRAIACIVVSAPSGFVAVRPLK
jgi:hypothetical protein